MHRDHIISDEAARLALLRSLQILDTPDEPVFDTMARLAARALDTPIALVSLVDERRQWFKARVGLAVRETAREHSFCAHAIEGAEPVFAVEDAQHDPRFRDNPLVTGEPGIRGYAGAVLRSADGHALGTLCVIDHRPRTFDAIELQTLTDLAALAQRELLQREASLQARQAAEQSARTASRSESLFEAIYRDAPVGIAMVGLQGGWLRFNDKLCEILGRGADELQALTSEQLTHPEDLALDLGHRRQLLAGAGDHYTMAKRYLRPDGSIVWTQLTVRLVREGKAPAYFIAVIEDISARREAEASLQALRQRLEERVAERTQALQRSNELLGESIRQRSESEAALGASEEELRAVLAQALDAYISLDAAGVVIEWNHQAERTFGWRRDEAVGRRLDELIIPPAYRAAHRAGLQRLAASTQPTLLGRRLELPALTKGGELIPCEITLNALRTPRGLVFFAFLHDVSERQRAQQALAEREQRLRLLADNIPALVAYIDPELRYMFVNQRYEHTFGVRADQVVGRTAASFLDAETFAWLQPLLQRALAGERVIVEREVQARGSSFWCLIHYVPDLDAQGRVRGLYGMTLDLSERRAAELALRASEQRLRDITDNLPAVVAHFGADERCRFANPRAEHFPAFARRIVEGVALYEVLGARYDDYRPHIARVLGGARASFEGMVPTRGQALHFQAHLVPDLGPDGAARGFYLLAYDQTELKQAERRSAAGEQRLRAITDNLPVLIAFIDAQQRYEFCNATYREWLGADPQALIGRTVRETLGDERYAPRAPMLARALAGERLEFVAEQATLAGLRQLQTLYVPQRADDGRVQGVYALVHDVTEIKQAEQRMAELARSDALTGLPNRRCLEERLAEALARARRSGAPMAVLFLDVDRFKTINDTLGHAVGDEVLREFALRVKGALRETDAVGRLAGDEFVVVLENLTTEAQPQFVARKILAAIARPFELERGVLDVATSIGIAYLEDTALDGEAALKIADRALYEAKAGGRNTFRLGRR